MDSAALFNAYCAGPHSTVGSVSDCRFRIYKFISQLGHITFVEIDHEIIPTVIFPRLLIQEWQLSVTGEIMCTKYWLAA